MADRSIRVRLIAEVQSYKAAMAQAGQATAEFGREISGQGDATRKQMEQVGRSALLMAGVIGAGLALSMKAALDWESAWAGVTKTVDGSASEMAELEDGLRGLASELPATHGEIAAVAEAAGQLGVKRDAIVGFTRTMVDLGETTNLTADEAATAMARMANIMQTPQGEIDRLGAALVALGNDGASTEREILDMAMRIASAGAQIGLTEGEVLGFANALSSVGIEAEAGGSAISRVMIEARNAVMDGGEALDTFAQTAGMSSEEFARAFREDAGGALISFIEGLGRMEAQGQNSNAVLAELGFADIRVGNALRAAASARDLFRESLELGNEAWDENTALADEAEKRYQTTAAQLEIARNNIVDLAIDVGGYLLPALAGAADGATTMARGFGDLPGPLKAVGVGIGGIATAGLGAIGVIGTFAPKIREAQAALMSMGTAGQFVGRNMGRMAAGLGVATVALGILTYHMGQNAQKAAESEARTDAFTDAIRETGTVAQGVSQQVRTMMEDAGSAELVEMFDKAGISAQEFSAALSGSEEEWQSFMDSLGAGPVLTELLNGLRNEAQAAAEHVDRAGEVIGHTGDAASGAAPGLDALGGSMGEVGGSADAVQEQLDAFNDEIDRLLAGAFSFQEASDALEQGIIDAGTHFADQAENLGAAGLALDGNSAAALANREVMRGLIEQSADVIRAGQEQGMSAEQLILIREAEKQKLRDLATQYGLNQEQVAGFIAVLDSIPIAKGTSIDVHSDEAYTKVVQVRDALGELKDKTITIGVTTALGANAVALMNSKLLQRWGGITSYAMGGIDAHVGQGDLIRYAEPATGGEAYIPRRGDTARSTAVLEQAASWYGLAVVPAGGYGSMAPVTTPPTAAQAPGRGDTKIYGPIQLQTPDSPRQWLDELSWRMAGAK